MDKFYIPGLICFGLFVLMYISDNVADAINYTHQQQKHAREHWEVYSEQYE